MTSMGRTRHATIAAAEIAAGARATAIVKGIGRVGHGRYAGIAGGEVTGRTGSAMVGEAGWAGGGVVTNRVCRGQVAHDHGQGNKPRL